MLLVVAIAVLFVALLAFLLARSRSPTALASEMVDADIEWAAAARRLCLTFANNDAGHRTMFGRIGGFQIRIEEQHCLGASFISVFEGERRFPPDNAIALLDLAPVFSEIPPSSRPRVDSGRLLASAATTGAIETLVPAMRRAATRLAKLSVPEQLLITVRGSQDGERRYNSLALLTTLYARSEQAPQALETALEDADPRIRVFAARKLGGERGTAILKRVVEDENAAADLRLSLLEHLRAKVPWPELSATYLAVLHSRDVPLQKLAVEAAAASAGRSFLEPVRALASCANEELAEAVATALGVFPDSNAESSLIELLGHASLAVRRAAALSLGKFGTVRAVGPLLPLTEGVLGDAAVKEAARYSIRMIQNRLGDAESGRISVAATDAASGAVSLATESTGGGELALASQSAPPDKAKE